MKGFFLSFEGGEGVGKSTQIALLAKTLESAGHPIQLTREPGGTALGVQIRALLLRRSSEEPGPETEFLLYQADRCEHVRRVLKPSLAAGQIVLCDRYVDSTAVYQGLLRGIPELWIERLAEFATGGLKPDLTFLLDLDPEQGLKRARERLEAEAKREDRFEHETLAFHRRIRAGFLERAEREPERFVVVSADGPVGAIAERIARIALERLEAIGFKDSPAKPL